MAASRPALRVDNIDLVVVRQLSAAVAIGRPATAASMRAIGSRRRRPARGRPDRGVQRPRHAGQPTIYSHALSEGEYRGRREIQLVLQRQQQSRHRPRSERQRSAGLAAGRRPPGAIRKPYYPNQQLLANKQLRWWWNNCITRSMTTATATAWRRMAPSPNGCRNRNRSSSPNMVLRRSIARPISRTFSSAQIRVQSATPFWSIWDPAEGGGFQPRQDDEIQLLALQALYEYWFVDGHNANSLAALPMIQPASVGVELGCAAVSDFPARSDVWGDAGNWQAGQ